MGICGFFYFVDFNLFYMVLGVIIGDSMKNCENDYRFIIVFFGKVWG